MSYGNTVKDGSGIFYHTLVNTAGELIMMPAGIIEQQFDVDVDNSDKTFTVPANYMWEILSIRVDYTSTATAGNRQICVEFSDGTNVILRILAGAVQAAGITRSYNFAHGIYELTAFRDTTHLSTPIPSDLILLPGYKLRVFDKAAIAAAADDLLVRMMIRKYHSA